MRIQEILKMAFIVAVVFSAVILFASALREETPQEAVSNTVIAYVDSKDPSTVPEAGYKYYNVPFSDELQEYMQDLCKSYGLQYEMVLALTSAETDYQIDLISNTNDYGIMQINKVNHQRLTETLGISDYLDPYQNIHAGIYMLSEIVEMYDTPQEILMVYNCGHARAKRLWEKGITTTKYTTKVLERMESLERR